MDTNGNVYTSRKFSRRRITQVSISNVPKYHSGFNKWLFVFYYLENNICQFHFKWRPIRIWPDLIFTLIQQKDGFFPATRNNVSQQLFWYPFANEPKKRQFESLRKGEIARSLSWMYCIRNWELWAMFAFYVLIHFTMNRYYSLCYFLTFELHFRYFLKTQNTQILLKFEIGY